jgi:hypothetical protein
VKDLAIPDPMHAYYKQNIAPQHLILEVIRKSLLRKFYFIMTCIFVLDFYLLYLIFACHQNPKICDLYSTVFYLVVSALIIVSISVAMRLYANYMAKLSGKISPALFGFITKYFTIKKYRICELCIWQNFIFFRSQTLKWLRLMTMR